MSVIRVGLPGKLSSLSFGKHDRSDTSGCRLRDFSQTYLHIQVLGENDSSPTPTPEQFAASESQYTDGLLDQTGENDEVSSKAGNKRGPPSPGVSTRQSKRLRQSAVKKGKTIMISVERGDTVLSLKRKASLSIYCVARF